MSDIKFACPVCGQHITANSAASGTQMECPTCFQNIVVPSRTGDSKLIFSAAKVAQPKSTEPVFPTGPAPLAPGTNRPRLIALVSLMAISALGIGLVAYGRMQQRFEQQRAAAESAPAPGPAQTWKSPFPVPENIPWKLDLTNVTVPDAIAAGRVAGHGFKVERATLQGGSLNLRQGKDWPPDLGFTVSLFSRQAEELAGKTIKVWPTRSPPVPRVTVRWKDEQRNARTSEIRAGYAMQVSFGTPAGGKMPGSIYICLPDEEKSFVAGRFLAEIRKPNPPRPAGTNRPPARPKPPGAVKTNTAPK